MFCPQCGSDQHFVIDSNHTKRTVRRRRRCTACESRWTTAEIVVSVRDWRGFENALPYKRSMRVHKSEHGDVPYLVPLLSVVENGLIILHAARGDVSQTTD